MISHDFQVLLDDFDRTFSSLMLELSHACFEGARQKGFYEDVDAADVLHRMARAARIACEASEIIDAVKKGRGESEKIPGFTCEEEEIADVIISTLDYARWREARVGEAVLAKLRHNATRPPRHGGLA